MDNKIKIFINKNTWWYKQLQSEIDDVMSGDCQDNITLPNDITYNYTIEEVTLEQLQKYIDAQYSILINPVIPQQFHGTKGPNIKKIRKLNI